MIFRNADFSLYFSASNKSGLKSALRNKKVDTKLVSTFLLLTFYLQLFLPKLIVTGFDLSHFTCGNEDCAFANIGHTVCHTFQIVGNP